MSAPPRRRLSRQWDDEEGPTMRSAVPVSPLVNHLLLSQLEHRGTKPQIPLSERLRSAAQFRVANAPGASLDSDSDEDDKDDESSSWSDDSDFSSSMSAPGSPRPGSKVNLAAFFCATAKSCMPCSPSAATSPRAVTMGKRRENKTEDTSGTMMQPVTVRVALDPLLVTSPNPGINPLPPTFAPLVVPLTQSQSANNEKSDQLVEAHSDPATASPGQAVPNEPAGADRFWELASNPKFGPKSQSTPTSPTLASRCSNDELAECDRRGTSDTRHAASVCPTSPETETRMSGPVVVVPAVRELPGKLVGTTSTVKARRHVRSASWGW